MTAAPFVSLTPRRAVVLFLAFAFAYFLSTLIRAVTATLAPTLVQEFALSAGDLGLLAGGYFFGFALTQLPLGTGVMVSGEYLAPVFTHQVPSNTVMKRSCGWLCGRLD